MFRPEGSLKLPLVDLCVLYFREHIQGPEFISRLSSDGSLASLLPFFEGFPERSIDSTDLWLPDEVEEEYRGHIGGGGVQFSHPPDWHWETDPAYTSKQPWAKVLPYIRKYVKGEWRSIEELIRDLQWLKLDLDLQLLFNHLIPTIFTPCPWDEYFPHVPSSFCGHGE